MKFDCGETRLEKYTRLEQWHEWFAWFPIRLGSHDCRWLEYVERKGDILCSMSAGIIWSWEYRAK